mmetsp:Transcript_34010/g.69337  ORF Transcript_34010/g.69337 Transcript_34010/m.69337 type:complete len:1431 (+) Transcript_34010:80-4372(+)
MGFFNICDNMKHTNNITLLVLNIILALTSSTTAIPTDCNTISRGRYHALVCWLWDAQIHLPNEQFKEEIFTISVNDLSCTNFQVASTKSSYVPSSAGAKKNNPSLQIDLTGISATCKGNYGWSGIGRGSGNVVASVSGNTVHLEVDVASAPLSDHVKHSSTNKNNAHASLPFPTLATVSSCQPNFDVHDVQFTGSAKIIGLFGKTISKKLTAVLNQHVCSLIKKNGEKAIDEALHAAGEYLGGLILHPPEEDASISANPTESLMSLAIQRSNSEALHTNLENDSVVSWDGDMPLLKRILSGINNFIGDHMNEGIILKTLQTINPSICEDCGFFFKGLNGMVNSFTRGTGSADFTVPETILTFHRNHTFNLPSYGKVSIAPQKMKVSGLNNLTELSLLRPVGQNSMSSSIASDAALLFTISMDMEVTPTKGGSFQGDTLNESFELTFNMSNVNLKADSSVVFDREVLNKLTVGSFISGSYTTYDSNRNIMNCVLEALSSIVLTDASGVLSLDNMSIAAIANAKETSTETSLEDNVDEVINNVLQLLVLEYPSTVTESLAALIHSPVRDFVNSALSKFIGDFKQLPLHCVNVEVPQNAVERPFRFDENVYLWMFDSLFDGGNMVDTVNSFIDCATNTLTQNTTLLSFRLGDMNVGLHNLTLANFGSVYELDLLLPEVDHYHIKNSIGWGKDTTLSFGMDVTHPSHHGRVGKMNAELKMTNLELIVGTGLKYDMNYLPNLEVTDLVAHPQCFAIPVTNFEYYDYNMTIDSLELTIDASLDNGIDGEIQTFSYKTSDPTELANIATSMMSDGALQLQQALERSTIVELKGEPNVCTTPANPQRSYNSKHPSETAAGAWTLFIVVVFVVFNSWLFMRGFKSDEYDGVPTSDEQNYNLTEPLLGNNDDSRNSSQDGMDEVMEVESPHSRKFPLSSSTSLMYHQSIHKTFKYGFPVILALTIILILSSNISIGASVDLQVTKSNGQSLTSLINIYQFSLSSTLGEMWRAGVYMLMLLIWFCSGVWPYVKLILMLVCWITSTRRLPPIKREKILYLLDALGKFSLIDTYVLVLMMVAFRYHLEVAGTGALDVYVTPKFGFYSFLVATIVSLVSGHAILFLHRRSTLPVIPVYSGRYESLSRHIFDDKHGRGLLKMTRFFRRTVIIAIVSTLVLLVAGANLHSFHFTFNGIAGVALGESRVREFSLVSIGESIPQSVQNASSFGIHMIKTTYFFFALVMPLVCLISLLILFVVPMRMRRQQQIFILVEVTNAWSAVEVFVISILVSLVEIGPFSSSMVEQHCSMLEKILAGFSTDELHHCFSVKSTIDSSAAVLITGVILNSLLVSTLHRLCHHAIWERIEREDRPDASADESNSVRDCVLAHTFVSNLRKAKLGYIIFEEVSFGPHGEFDINFESVVDDEEPGSSGFWDEWNKMVSVI